MLVGILILHGTDGHTIPIIPIFVTIITHILTGATMEDITAVIMAAITEDIKLPITIRAKGELLLQLPDGEPEAQLEVQACL